ncbi:hypothetical protein J2795_004269 [Chryseobacterium bernardetii]|jgi:hypothetical protein|uniref:Tetratricopeptide repeat protein n=2 Tax=Chryseobacterium TaxID=59732 RepID=A0A543DV24_9FLAO|nr:MULTISPECIES: hypothetical protein [Chryseobacterium]MDR6373080.1 hypothetical protein [Chryseobacterium vietnamense]MDR6443518.1 hypothetical protein [Chryseobacterium bernardetii]TQM13180.1 hypothetical protein FB551_4550 [Chryseobacterium aquifrigidense]
MYKFFLILFLSVSLQLSSQINTQLLANSSWTRVKFSMLDGSRDLSQRSSQVLVWKIKGNNLCLFTDALILDKASCMDFKLEKELMKTSDLAGYQIEKLTADSLVVIQRIVGIDSPDKIKKTWFIKSSIVLNNFVREKKNDSIIIASKNFTPSLKRNIISEILENYSQKDFFYNFSSKGNILIFPKKQKVEVETEYKDETKANQKGIAFFKTTIEKNYHLWDLTGFESFEKIIIPYEMSIKNGNRSGLSTMGIRFYGFSNDAKEFPVFTKNKFASTDNFNKGMDALNKQKFDNAIYFFNEAYDNDNTNTDALYNIVSISLAQNKSDIACTALKKLNDLEQTEGAKLYNEKCAEK